MSKNNEVESKFEQNNINKSSNKNLNIKSSKEIKNQITIQKITKERRNAIFPINDKEKEISKESLLKFLGKIPGLRSFYEIHAISEYLSKNYEYFTKLKNEQGEGILEKITRISRLESFQKGSKIIRYGDIGEKFYILLEGIVEVFKPKFIEKNETPKNFLKYLKKIKDEDGDENKYKRIQNKNINFFQNMPEEINSNKIVFRGFDRMEYKQIFNIEIDEKMGEYSEGFSFGDIALIKKTPRNATIKAKEKCILLTINNDEYNRAILDYQKKKLNKDIDYFIKTYSFFRNFDSDKIVKLFNCFNKIELFRGDFLYKQNDEANSIYVLNNGSFVAYSCISFPWINDYINYMDYSEKNILNFLIENRNVKTDDLMKFLQDFQENNKTHNKITEKFEEWFKINENQKTENLYNLKRDEEKLNSSEYVFQMNLKKVDYKDILGLEEIFDFKKRLINYKCISEKAELKEIKFIDLMRLILNMSRKEISILSNIVEERKKLLKNQIINSLENLDKELIMNFDHRYENLINSKKSENKEDVLLSSLKIKGYKTSIQDLLDKRVTLFPYEPNPTPRDILKKIKRKNKSSEELLNNFYKNKRTLNELKFYKKMNNIRLIKNKLENKDFLNSISNNYQNVTPSMSISKTISHNFLSPQNSDKYRRNKLLQLNNKSRFYSNIIKKDSKNFKENKIFKNINFIINNKNISKRKIFPILLNDKKHTNQSFPRLINKFNKTDKYNKENTRESFENKEKEYKGFFHIFNHLDKNFYMGEHFEKKFKKEYNLRYKF